MIMQAQVPKLDVGMYTVLFTEKATGILLTTSSSRYLGEGEFYRVFNSEREAEEFAQDYVQSNPEVECSIRDCEGIHIRFVASH
jgi:hypothetical protein